MSELINRPGDRDVVRLKLLCSVSLFVLAAHGFTGEAVASEEDSQPQVWIQLGGQFSHLDDGQDKFAAPFEEARPAIFSPSQRFEKQPGNSFDSFGQIDIHPQSSRWSLSASIQYGRSNSKKHEHQQTYPGYGYFPSAFFVDRTQTPRAARFADTVSHIGESHTILDFSVGRDVGLGLFGSHNISSSINFGVRFSQFLSKENISLKSDPDWRFAPKYFTSYYYGSRFKFIIQPYHDNAANLRAERSFSGWGPSLRWKASVPLAGVSQAGEVTLDIGVNGALLFGRQKVKVQHDTTMRYNDGGNGIFSSGALLTVYHHAPPSSFRSRSVTIPNVGGFAGFSIQYDVAKVSFGYKADFFFGAMDGGIDVRKTYDRNFYGPFANISIGLGG